MISGSPMKMIDAVGTVHEAAPHARIVSLVPSITELLCDLGLAGQLVGRTGFCIHPSGIVQSISKIGGTKDVNIEKIRKLAPTHLVVNIDENEQPTVAALAEFVPHIVVTHPNTPRDNYIANMLAEIGWNVPDLGAARYPRFDWSPELVEGIDGVLLSSEPYRFTEQHADALERQIGKPVLLVDGEMMSWYGSRSLLGLRYLRELAQA